MSIPTFESLVTTRRKKSRIVSGEVPCPRSPAGVKQECLLQKCVGKSSARLRETLYSDGSGSRPADCAIYFLVVSKGYAVANGRLPIVRLLNNEIEGLVQSDLFL
ncbi:hypothetical protein J3459_017447 [Metarhizium acridum]|nr:hypothetical protein J3459_017447 [Metarhizium acridum]